MNVIQSHTPNVFQIYKQIGRVPFAVSRRTWSERFVAVVTCVIPKDDYGFAYGFLVKNGVPSDGFSSEPKWRSEMVMPNAGSYQWRLVEMPEGKLKKLIDEFYATVGKQYGFDSPADDRRKENEWLESLIKPE